MPQDNNATIVADPYKRRKENVMSPPTNWAGVLRHLGPGLILTGSIVGTGELIATTTLGAQVGFAALWLILISCFIKVIVQAELGRYTISSGETTLKAFDGIAGPRLGASWLVWWWMIMNLVTLLQLGAMVGGVGQALTIAFPVLGGNGWAGVCAILAALLLLTGRYGAVESITLVMVALFTFVTVGCVVLLWWTPYSISLSDVVGGLKFSLPGKGAVTALAAFGITGVGAAELIAYPYWCVEKGYARFTGEKEDSEEWVSRSKGWIRVMHVDVVVSMIVFTLATVAFYFLGASVLFGKGEIPKGFKMVETLSKMYTETLGPWALYFFLVGAFFVLFSTLFVATAGNSRITADWLGILGVINAEDFRVRMRWIRICCVVYPCVSVVLYLIFKQPVFMVVIGGVMQAATLPMIATVTLYLRYKRVDRRITPSLFADILLWVALIFITVVSIYAVYSKIAPQIQ